MISIPEYTAARAKLTEADFTKDGLPKVGALNAMLSEAIDAARRDKLEDARGSEEATPAPQIVTLTITAAMTNPVTLRLNGAPYRLRVGTEYDLPPEAVAALRDTHVKFSIKE